MENSGIEKWLSDVLGSSLHSSLGWAPFPRALWEDPSLSSGADVDLHICMFLVSDEIRRCIFNQSLQRGWALGGSLKGGRGNVTAKVVQAWEPETLGAPSHVPREEADLAGLWGWEGDLTEVGGRGCAALTPAPQTLRQELVSHRLFYVYKTETCLEQMPRSPWLDSRRKMEKERNLGLKKRWTEE